jgi:hypothetical protein
MSALSAVLREAEGGVLFFWCPGCDGAHSIRHGAQPGPCWGWNGNVDKPTFTPSVLVTFPASPAATEEFKEWRTKRICHSFVADGHIQFLGDCTHALAGQTVDLPKWNQEEDQCA